MKHFFFGKNFRIQSRGILKVLSFGLVPGGRKKEFTYCGVLQTLPVKGQTIDILDFASHTISVTTVELRCGNTKTAKDSNPYVNGAIVFQ